MFLLKKNGYVGTSIRDICGRSGVSVGTFYLYYRSKDDILSELLHRKLNKDEKAIVSTQPTSGQSVYPIVEELMCHWAEAFSSYAAGSTNPNVFPPHFFHKHVISSQSPFFLRMKETIEFGQSDGTLSTEVISEEICWKLIRFGRGIVHDWVLREQEYNLIAFLKVELRFYFRLFTPN